MADRLRAALSGLMIASDLKAGRLQALHRAPIGIHEPIWFVCRAQPRADPALRALIDGLMWDFSVFGAAPEVEAAIELRG